MRRIYVDNDVLRDSTGLERDSPAGNAAGYDKVRIQALFVAVDPVICADSKPYLTCREDVSAMSVTRQNQVSPGLCLLVIGIGLVVKNHSI